MLVYRGRETLVANERQFEYRALEVIHQHVDVVRIDEGRFRRPPEEVTRILDHILIERCRRGDKD